MRFVFVFLIVLIANSFAFNSRECRSFNHEGYTLPSKLFSSTTSYITSTGPCSAIGLHEERERFIVLNYELLKLDSAKGYGEYLETLAYMYGYRGQQIEQFGIYVQDNFEYIFKNDKEVFEKFESFKIL